MTNTPDLYEDPKQLRKKRLIAIFSLAVIVVLFIILGIVVGRPLIQAIRDRTSFRDWMSQQGLGKYPLMVGIMVLQIIIAIIPGEPIEFGAGFIFGPWMGLVLCLLGCIIGSVLILLAVRTWGMKFVTLFVSKEQIGNMKFLRDPKKRDVAIFFLFLLPGTPKDVLTYLAGLVPIHMGKYLLLTTIARIPSVFTSTLAGSTAGDKRYSMTLIIYGVTAVLTLIGYLIYKAYNRKVDIQEAAREAEELLIASQTQAAITEQQQAPDMDTKPTGGADTHVST